MIRTAVQVLVLLASLLVVPQEAGPQGNTAKRLEKIREYLADAGDLYKQKEYAMAGKKIAAAIPLMERAAGEADPGDRPFLEKEYARLARAHELLTARRVELPELGPLPQPGARPPSPPATFGGTGAEDVNEMKAVSFSKEIEPLLARHCGTCHIRKASGEFSMASYEALREALGAEAVVAGKPDDSRLVQVIEEGSMPPGQSGNFSEKDLETIRSWIAAGAEFDGEDPAAPLGGGLPPRRGR